MVKVKDISIEFEAGNNLFMNYEMVNKLLIQNNESVLNKVKSVLDLHKLETQVIKHPMVENASVYITVDGDLKTKITQRAPIARVVTEDKSYYIDRQAKVMPLSAKYSARVLLVSGNINEKNQQEIYKIYELANAILKDEFLNKQIIDIQKIENNEFVMNVRIGDQKIYLGKIEDLNQKFKNLKSFFNKAMIDHSIDNYVAINLKYNNQVVCTKR